MLSVPAAGASTESGGKTVSTRVPHNTVHPSTWKIVTCAVPMPYVLKPGILDTWSQHGPNTLP